MTLPQTDCLMKWLAALHGDGDGYCEVRYRTIHDGKWHQSFFSRSDRERAADWRAKQKRR